MTNTRNLLGPFTPKEFSEYVLGGRFSADWVRNECHCGRIQTVRGAEKPPYLIPVSEAVRFCPLLERWLVAV